MPHASRERGGLRRAAHIGFTLFTPRARTPTRAAAAFRTAHLHSGPIARTKFECAFDAPIIARGKFSTFSDPPKSWWGLARTGLCSSAARRGLGRPRGRWPRRRRPKRRSRSVPLHTGWMRSPSHCERHDAHALSGDIVFIHTVRCVGPPPCDCAWACVRRGDGGDCVCVRNAVVAGSIDSTARSPMWSGGQCAVGTHMCAHERT
jgi:hypothetical protein